MSTPKNDQDLYRLLSRLCEGRAAPNDIAWLEEALDSDAQIRRLWLDFFATEADTTVLVRRESDGSEVESRAALVDFDRVFFEIQRRRAEDDSRPNAKPDGDRASCNTHEPAVGDSDRPGTKRRKAAGSAAMRLRHRPVAIAVAAMLVAVLLGAGWFWFPRARDNTLTSEADHSVQPRHDIAGRLVRAERVAWGADDAAVAERDDLHIGQTVRLAQGIVEIEFNSGATVVLKGPTEFRLEGKNDGYLGRGTLVARVEGGAEGFVIRTPLTKVVDLGTEFGLSVEENGREALEVYRGAVAVAPSRAETVPTTRVEQGRQTSVAVIDGAVEIDVSRGRGDSELAELRHQFRPLVGVHEVSLLSPGKNRLPTDVGSDDMSKVSLVDHAELGGKALRVERLGGDSFGDRIPTVTNWSPFSAVEFEAFNPGRTDVRMILTVKHQRTSGYETRIEAPFTLKPGKNEVSLNIQEMTNVDGSKPDLAHVARWYIAQVEEGAHGVCFGDIVLRSD